MNVHPERPTTSTELPVPLPRAFRNEQGSAYLAALLVLVLLTIIGVSLSLITQTEMQIGANEKSIQRAFYAADTGVDLSTARTLVERRPAWSEVYDIEDPAAGNTLQLEHRVDVSPFFPIAMAPCNLCDVNNSGQYGSKNYQRVNHAVTATAIRQIPNTDIPLAEKTISTMMEFQPWETGPEQILAIQDETQLAKIKF